MTYERYLGLELNANMQFAIRVAAVAEGWKAARGTPDRSYFDALAQFECQAERIADDYAVRAELSRAKAQARRGESEGW